MNYLVSVVTVVYNGSKTIERCINSVFDQDYKNIEYIIIDGGSTDGTLEIIEKYRNRLAYFMSQKDNGIYDAMNIGIKASKGDVVVLLNADDWFEPEAISTGIDILERYDDVDIVHSNMVKWEKNKAIISSPKLSNSFMFWRGMAYFHPTFFVRRRIYDRKLYDAKYRIVADYKFTMECLKEGVSFYFLNKALVNFLNGGISSTLCVRIWEGHKIRMELGFNAFLVWVSTVFRFTLGLACILKTFLCKNFFNFSIK